MKYNRGQGKLIQIKISILHFPIFPFLHSSSFPLPVFKQNSMYHWWTDPWYVYSIRNLSITILWITYQRPSLSIPFPIFSSPLNFFLQFPFASLLSQTNARDLTDRRSVNERETSLTMVDLLLLVISRAVSIEKYDFLCVAGRPCKFH